MRIGAQKSFNIVEYILNVHEILCNLTICISFTLLTIFHFEGEKMMTATICARKENCLPRSQVGNLHCTYNTLRQSNVVMTTDTQLRSMAIQVDYSSNLFRENGCHSLLPSPPPTISTYTSLCQY